MYFDKILGVMLKKKVVKGFKLFFLKMVHFEKCSKVLLKMLTISYLFVQKFYYVIFY